MKVNKMNKMFNTIALIVLILSSDVILALQKTNTKISKTHKTGLNSSSNSNLSSKFKKNSNLQAPPTSTQTAPVSTPTQTPAKNDSSPSNSQIAGINALDQSGTTLQSDPFAAKAVNSSLYASCKDKFYNIIAALPDNLQSAILSEFNANTQSNSCCDSEKLIKSVSTILNSQMSSFADLLTNQQRNSKRGFACFRAPEIVAKEEDLPLEKTFPQKNKEFISKLLLDQNTLSSNLLKCVNQINKISIRNLGLLCSANDMVDKIFNKDSANSNRFASIKKFPDDDKNIYTDCVDYVKNYDSFSNTILGAYVDSLNFLIGTDKCNYFSNLFTMDPLKDKEDPYLPKELAQLAAQSATNANNTNNNANDSNSPMNLLNSWFSCASTKSEFLYGNINELKTNINRAQYTNPFGLSTYIGRADINYSLIKQKFDLVNFPYYHVKCSLAEGCSASFKGTSNSRQPDLASVVTGLNTKLEVSCCDFICVVYVKIEDTLSDNNYYNSYSNGYSSTKQLEGAEVFRMKSDRNSLDISSLDLLEIRNAKNCFSKSSANPVAFLQKSQSNSEQALPTATTSTPTNSAPNPTTTTIQADETKKFNNSNFINILNDLYANPSKYENDFRLKTSTMLKVTFDGQTRSLNDLLYNELFKAEISTSYVQCENGVCLLQQALGADSANSTPDKTFKLEAYSETQASIPFQSQIAMKKSSSSGGRSSGSSKSSSSSSKSSSSGSSFSSSSKSSGGSYSSSSSGSSFSSTSKSSGGSYSSSSSGSSFSKSSSSSGSNGFNSATSYGSSSGSSKSSSSGSSFNKSLYPSSNKSNNISKNNYSNSVNSNNSSFNNNSNFKPSNSNSKSNNFFNNYSTTNNYNFNSNNNNYNPSSNYSNYATKIKVSSSPNSSFNSNYYNKLYESNYNYSSLKVKVSNPVTSISSYHYGYNSYNSNSYISSVKIKDNKIKVKVKYYPSYTYNPIYSNVYYPYNRYYQYNYYSHYYRPNYYNYYYQNQNLYNNNPVYSGLTFNSLNLSPEFNEEDWLPSFKPNFDRDAYLKSLNYNLTSVRIYSQCCETWCAYVIQNSSDGLKAENSAKTRIYVEVILKNYAFFDSSLLTAAQKKCLIQSIQNSLSTNTLKDNNIFQKCGIKSPYDVIPVKQNCLQNMNDHCKTNGFADLMDKSAIYVQSSAEANNGECLAPLDCFGENPSEEQMVACGANLYKLYSTKAFKPAFKGFIYPCLIKGDSTNTAARVTSMIEKFMKQSPPSSNNTGTSNVINLNDFSSDQKLKLERVKTLASNQINVNIAIDNNTALKVNTNTAADASLVNSGTDSAVASAIVDSISDESNDNEDPYQSGGIYANSASFSKSTYMNAILVVLIFMFI